MKTNVPLHGMFALTASLWLLTAWGFSQRPKPHPDLPHERIVYTTRRPTNWHLYLFEAGSSPKQITSGSALDYDATFSPDGRWIVFCSERSGAPHLYAIDVRHPGRPKQLTHGQFMEAAPAFTPDGKSLLFVSDRDGNADIFAMPFRPDGPGWGKNARNLTHNPHGDFRPAVSPDGKWVAFSSDRDNWPADWMDRPGVYDCGPSKSIYCAEIYVMDLNGSNPRRLTRLHAMSGSPVWSHDGHTLYFYSDRSGSFRVWAMNSDGTQQRPLAPKEVSAFSPSVMPDGRIAFAGKKPEGFQIMSVAADGSGVRIESGKRDCRGPAFDHSGRMACTGGESLAGRSRQSNPQPFVAPGTHSKVRLPDRILDIQAVSDQFCSISPDGREIVTSQLLPAGGPDAMRLVTSALNGSNAREIFRQNSAPVWAMSWARRADLIAFTVGPQFAPDDAVVDIWTVHSDGSDPTNLTKGKFRNNAFPDLTPDGSQILFRSTRDGSKQIYLMNSDGTNVRRITTDGENYTMPAMSPHGDMIAFSGTTRFRIYLQLLKGGKPEGAPRLIQKYSPSVHSRFSPDGRWIVFASRRGWLNDEAPLSNGNDQPYGEIFVQRVDGSSEPIRLTHNKWEDSVPCWGVMSSFSSSAHVSSR